MPRLCERPGCSSPAEIAYGIEQDRLVVWLETLPPLPVRDHRSGVLCRRHADSMVVPLRWTLDDRREPAPRLFRPPPVDVTGAIERPARKKKAKRAKGAQLRLDEAEVEVPPSATREPVAARLFETPPRIPRKPRAVEPATKVAVAAPPSEARPERGEESKPAVAAAHRPVPQRDDAPVDGPDDGSDEQGSGPWYPSFDEQDDLGGLLIPKGPLMARAFGQPHQRSAERS